MEVMYDANDLIFLERFLHDDMVDTLEFTSIVICKLSDIVKDRIIEPKDIKELLSNWLWLFFHKAKEIEDFIFNKKIEEVPLFVNDNDLKVFAKWRLYIAK